MKLLLTISLISAIIGILVALAVTGLFVKREIHIIPRMVSQPYLTAAVSWIEVGDVVSMREVTAYTLGNPAETDDTPCIGAYNENLCVLAQSGVQICASNSYVHNTVLRVGDIQCIVKDKMNRRYVNGEVDLAMMDRQEALAFGRRSLEIKIIK